MDWKANELDHVSFERGEEDSVVGGGGENVPKVRDGDNTRRMQNMIADLFWCLLIESMFNNSLISMWNF